MATMCAGGTLKLWELRRSLQDEAVNNQFEQAGEILFGKNLQEAFALSPIGTDFLLLAVGGFDKNIHFYTCELARVRAKRGEKCSIHDLFSYKLSLTGHMDSIKDLCFTTQKFAMVNGDVQYLASCSQDQKIRLWKIQPLKDVREEFK
jgi:WD40 repeat protein